MSYKLKNLGKPASGAGAPSLGSRHAYVALVDDLLSFPDTDDKNVLLLGQPVFKEGKGWVKVYISNNGKEYTYTSEGEIGSLFHKVSFKGTHPGTELEALEFAQNNLDQEFIVAIPGCQSTDPIKILGRPCSPLVFKSSHKSANDGSKFEFTFEQEVGSKYIYFIYNGALAVTTDAPSVDFSNPVAKLSEVMRVAQTAEAKPLSVTSAGGFTGSQVTLIGQEPDPAKAGTVDNDTTSPVLVMLKDGVQWKALAGSTITFEVFDNGTDLVLLERWRT